MLMYTDQLKHIVLYKDHQTYIKPCAQDTLSSLNMNGYAQTN